MGPVWYSEKFLNWGSKRMHKYASEEINGDAADRLGNPRANQKSTLVAYGREGKD